MNNFVSVIIPTYNPNPDRLTQTIQGLKQQSLPHDQWELIVIDNHSTHPLNLNINWHSNAKLVREDKPGLTYARLRGFKEASGSYIVMVDDDNILDENYLQKVKTIFESDQKLGAIGGKSIPLFEAEPPIWLEQFYGSLALRDAGDIPMISRWENKYPSAAPIGAGMAIRATALTNYIEKVTNSATAVTDRIGKSLSSGGDNDIVLEIVKAGWTVGYFHELSLQHIIPESRTQKDYLSKLLNNTNRSWMQVLRHHQINPWPKIPKWTVPLRKAKAWITYKAWKNAPAYINWQGACGMFDGLAD